jgi:hypothetical protein
MDMQQRAPLSQNCDSAVDLNSWGNQRLWKHAKANPDDKELLIQIRARLLGRTRDNAREAVAWIEGRLLDIERSPVSPPTKRSGWRLAAILTAGFLAVSGGIAHGAGVSIWHELIKPLFVGG